MDEKEIRARVRRLFSACSQLADNYSETLKKKDLEALSLKVETAAMRLTGYEFDAEQERYVHTDDTSIYDVVQALLRDHE